MISTLNILYVESINDQALIMHLFICSYLQFYCIYRRDIILYYHFKKNICTILYMYKKCRSLLFDNDRKTCHHDIFSIFLITRIIDVGSLQKFWFINFLTALYIQWRFLQFVSETNQSRLSYNQPSKIQFHWVRFGPALSESSETQ